MKTKDTQLIDNIGEKLDSITGNFNFFDTDIPFGLALITKGKVTWTNKEFARVLGFSKDDLLGSDWNKAVPGLEIKLNIIPKIYKFKDDLGMDRHCLYRCALADDNFPNDTVIVTLFDITRFVDINREKLENEEKYRAIFNGSAEGYLLISDKILDCNKKAEKIFNISRNEFIGRDFLDFAPETQPDEQSSKVAFQKRLENTETQSLPYFYWQSISNNGRNLDLEIWIRTLKMRKGSNVILMGIRDVSESLRLSAELARSQAEFRKLYQSAKRDEQLIKSLLSVSGDPIVIHNSNRECLFVNSAFTRVFGWQIDELNDKPEMFIPETEIENDKWLWDEVSQNKPVVGMETIRLSKENKEIPVSVSAAAVFDQHTKQPINTLIILRDVTSQKEAAKAMLKAFELQKKLADRDGLTGLLNHRCIHDQIEKEIFRSRRSGSFFSLVMIDLDNFKNLNDRHGHLFGDEALRFTADILNKNTRSSDIVGRWGGDEFIMLLPDTDFSGAKMLIERIAHDLKTNILTTSDKKEVRVKASFGITVYPFDSASKIDLINQADKAMYSAKASSGNYNTCYGPVGPKSQDWNLQQENILSLLDILSSRDDKTMHRANISVEVAERIGNETNLSFDEMEKLRLAAMIHDLGNIYIPEEINNKQAMLKTEEIEIVDHHPVYLANMLRKVDNFDMDIIDAIFYHHERWDGTGLPAGLKGSSIPFYARILNLSSTVADLLTDNSSEISECSDDNVEQALRSMSGKELDPELVEIFLASKTDQTNLK